MSNDKGDIMSVKLLKKIFCFFNIIFVTLLVCCIGIILADEKENFILPNITRKEKNFHKEHYTLEYYTPIWKTTLGKKGKRRQEEDIWTKVISKITLKSIHSRDYALIQIAGKEYAIETYKKEKQSIIRNGQRINPWEIKIFSHVIIVKKIIPNKGIILRYNQREILLLLQGK